MARIGRGRWGVNFNDSGWGREIRPGASAIRCTPQSDGAKAGSVGVEITCPAAARDDSRGGLLPSWHAALSRAVARAYYIFRVAVPDGAGN